MLRGGPDKSSWRPGIGISKTDLGFRVVEGKDGVLPYISFFRWYLLGKRTKPPAFAIWHHLPSRPVMLLNMTAIFTLLSLSPGLEITESKNRTNCSLQSQAKGKTGKKQPLLVWLSGLSASLWTKGLPVQWAVTAHAWVAGQVPSRECKRGNHTLMFLFLSFSLPSPL